VRRKDEYGLPIFCLRYLASRTAAATAGRLPFWEMVCRVARLFTLIPACLAPDIGAQGGRLQLSQVSRELALTGYIAGGLLKLYVDARKQRY